MIFFAVSDNILLIIPHINKTHLHGVALPNFPAAQTQQNYRQHQRQP